MSVVILTASPMKKKIGGDFFSGKCITGYDLAGKKFIRFVGNTNGAPMMGDDIENFHPFDIVDIPIIDKCPITCQTENVLGDYEKVNILGKYEKGIETIYKDMQMVFTTEPSFMQNKSYKLQSIAHFKHSLELIKVEDLKVFVQDHNGKQKTKCSFQYNGSLCRYYSVTDPDFSLKESDVGNAYLVVSIPSDNPDNIGYYKFVAAIYPKN